MTPAKIPARKTLPICCYRFLGGDFPALSRLAGELYDFVSKCNSEVTPLAEYVEKLVGDSGQWQGATAMEFRNSFGGDAMLMNGLAKTTSACAEVIDNLAYNLAYLESKIEEKLIEGVENGYFSLDHQYKAGDAGLEILTINLKAGLTPTVRRESGSVGQAAGRTAGALCESALKKAKNLRKSAAGQLALLCGPISKSMDLYTSPTGEQYERERFGLLRSDQIKNDSIGIKNLQAQFKSAEVSAGLSASDVRGAGLSLKKLTGDAQTIGGIVSDLKGWKSADFATRFTSGASAVDSVGPLLTDLALFVALVPK